MPWWLQFAGACPSRARYLRRMLCFPILCDPRTTIGVLRRCCRFVKLCKSSKGGAKIERPAAMRSGSSQLCFNRELRRHRGGLSRPFPSLRQGVAGLIANCVLASGKDHLPVAAWPMHSHRELPAKRGVT